MTIFARFLIVVPLVLAACSAVPGTSLDGRTFLSTSITTNGEPQDLVPGTRVRLSFSDGQLSASAGCNTMGGTYAIADGQLRVTGLATTEMGCDADRHDQDAWLSAFLGAGPAVTLAGNELVLAMPGGSIELLDREVADPDLALVGPTWTVQSIISGEAVSSVSVVATLTFLADGRVTFDSGCNTGGGRYSATADKLRFSDLVTTDMACDGPAGEMEGQMLQVLGAESVTYHIEAGNLELLAGDVGLGLTGR
jgi:heat shock protein HslJ